MANKVQYRTTNCLEVCSAHCVEVCKSLWSLQQSSQLCDMFLTAGDEVIFAHRNVLAAFSPIFHSKGTGLENTEAVLEIHVVDTPSVVVKEVIRYLYTGFIVLSKGNVNEVENLCKRWQIDSAVKLCNKFKKESEKLDGNNGMLNDKNEKCKKGLGSVNDNSLIALRKRLSHTQECEERLVEICEKFPRVESVNLTDLATGTDNAISCGADKSPIHTPSDTTTPQGALSADNTVKRKESTCDQYPQGSSNDLLQRLNTSASNTPLTCNGFRTAKKKTIPRKTPRSAQSSTDCSILQDGDPKHSVEVIDRTKCQKEGVAQTDAPNTPSAHPQQTTKSMAKNKIICPLCQKLLSSVKTLSKHKQKCKACPKCREIFKTRKKCVSHIGEKSCIKWGAEKFKCPECEKSYLREGTRDTHVRKCHPRGEFTGPGIRVCKVEGCNFQTQLQRNLNKHIKYMHTETKNIMCDICGAMSKNVYYLRVHQRERHSDAIACDICGLRVKTRSILKSHKMRQHGQGTPEYLCAQCTYITYTKTELDKHMFHKHKVPLPSGNEGYTCPHCQWQSIQKTSMDQHILRHTAKERNFPCTICNKRFITGADLKGHMVCHDPDRKKFKCPHCDYCTAYGRFKLREHVSRIHENKDYKPWECNLCSYRTNIKGNLTSHLRKTHKLNVDTQQHIINKVAPLSAAKAKMGGNADLKGGAPGPTVTTDGAHVLTGTVCRAPGMAKSVDRAPGMTGTTSSGLTKSTGGAPNTTGTTVRTPGSTVVNGAPGTVSAMCGAPGSTGTVGIAPDISRIMGGAPGTAGSNGDVSSTGEIIGHADWQKKEPSELVQPLIVAPLTPLPQTPTQDNQPAGQGVIPATSGSNQTFCVSTGLFSLSSDNLAQSSTLSAGTEVTDAISRTGHSQIPITSTGYVDRSGQQTQSQSHLQLLSQLSQSPTNPQSHLHTLTQLESQPHLIPHTQPINIEPLPINIAPIEPGPVVKADDDGLSNQSMYMERIINSFVSQTDGHI